MKEAYFLFENEFGWIGLRGFEGRLTRLVLPKPSRDEAKAALLAGATHNAVETNLDFSSIVEQVLAYFNGIPVDFECSVELEGASDFEKAVWAAAREVGYGRITSYGSIARRISIPTGARAVGRALGRNRVPLIIPCHRIIRSDGSLGGFADGLDWKQRLLRIEGQILLGRNIDGKERGLTRVEYGR